MQDQNHRFVQTQMCCESDKHKTRAGHTYTVRNNALSVVQTDTFLSLAAVIATVTSRVLTLFIWLIPVFSLSCVCVWLTTFLCLSSSSTVVSELSANLNEPQWRRPLPDLNSKENIMFPKLGRPMKSESEDRESGKEKHGK